MARVDGDEGPCAYYGDGPCPGVDVLGDGTRSAEELGGCRFTFVDRKGSVLAGRLEGAGAFSEGLAVAGDHGWDGPAGLRYIDRGGRTAIAGPFFKGLAHVRFDHPERREGGRLWRTRRFAYIDRSGRTVFAYQYETEG